MTKQLTAKFDALALVENGCILAANEQYAVMFGYSTNELIGFRVVDCVAPEDRERVSRYLDDDQAEPWSHLACRKDGSLFVVEVQATTVQVGERRVQSLVLQDSTARRATQLISDHHFDELDYLSKTALHFLEGMPPESLYQFIADQVASLAGSALVWVGTYTPYGRRLVPEAVSGSPGHRSTLQARLGHSLVGTTLPISETALSQMINGELVKVSGGFHAFTFGNYSPSICHAIERDLNFQAFYHLPLLIDGELLGMVQVAMIGQVTPQNPYLITAFVNQAGIALHRHRVESDLECERAYLATAIDMLPIPLTFITPDKQVQRRNRAMQLLLGRLGAQHEHNVQCLHPTTLVKLHKEQYPFLRALRGEVIEGEELVLNTEQTPALPVIVHCAPITLEDTVVAAVAAVDDITALKEADRIKDKFFTILSHELKTPLTCILGWTELAQIRNNPDISQQALDVIYRNARRQQQLINELLDVSRIMNQRFVLSLEALDLGDQVQQALENIQLEAEQRQITLISYPSKENVPVLADPIRLQQCFSNLLQNSLKFTPADGAITVSCTHDEHYAVVTLTDTGRGIKPEFLSQLFRPFVQEKRNESEGGLGLGLALVHGIIALHNGEIYAESAGEGLGSTFIIRLPMHIVEN